MNSKERQLFDIEGGNLVLTQLRKLIDSLIPLNICRLYQLVPLVESSTQPLTITVGMVNPDNLLAQDVVSDILRRKKMAWRRVVITLDVYQQLIAYYTNEHLEETKEQEYLKSVDVAGDLKELELVSSGVMTDSAYPDLNLVLQRAKQAPVVNLVNKILIKAIQNKASDIHVEPQEECLRIRFRKDGILQQALEPLPYKIAPSVIARFKILASLDIAERRLPQDGRLRQVFQNRKIDFRVSTLPTRFGEKIVLRILDNDMASLRLDKLIIHSDTLQIVREMVSRPYGLILVTGPTGSGKTTTLYSALSELNSLYVNISTVEDPVEYILPGITQVQVVREKGLDFPRILRSLLRQDPNVIMVGETRDAETAKVAIEAALTGHVVMTSLHTNDAAGAIARLDEIGIQPFMISSSLIGVLAQRLVRRVCPACRIPYIPTTLDLERYGKAATSQFAEMTLFKANQEPDVVSGTQVCDQCKGVGYNGRCGVYEVLKIDEELRGLISDRAPTEKLKKAAINAGMKTMLDYSLDLVQQGITTLKEVERVVFVG